MSHRNAFSLIELLVVIAIVALLMSILLPTLASARKAARTAVCQSNMKQLGAAHHSYTHDYKSFIAAFNGKGYLGGVEAGDGSNWPETDIVNQANAIVKLVTQRAFGAGADDLKSYFSGYSGPFTPVQEQYSHFMLVPYMGDVLPMPASVCIEDQPRLDWQKHPLSMSTSPYKPSQGVNGQNLSWWPYSSSYQLMPTAWAKDGPEIRDRFPGQHAVVSQATRQDTYFRLSGSKRENRYGERRIDEVTYPSQKVAVADSQQRHFGRVDLYYAFSEARQPLLFWDGAVSTRTTADANKGWDAQDPNQKIVERFEYRPDLAFEAPKPYGVKAEESIGVVGGYYKWTRGGLRGIDYGGAEISTKNW